ncbi:MAG: PAS domain-containing sensor histidine kinase, partial [Candidatus Sifarchaeia archaeon]
SYYTLKSVQKRRTERALVESERKLRESEAKLAEAQRIAHLGYWDWNIIEDNIRWSDETFRIFGLAPQEFEANYDAFLSSVHPSDRDFVRESVNNAIHENQKYSIDHRITLPNGKIRFVHEDAEITFDEDGKAIRMMGTVQDITDRIQQEYLLREERNKAERYLDLAGIMIMTLDSKFKVTMINQKGCELLDSEEKDILGRNWIEAYIPENSRKIVVQYLSSLVAGANSGSCEMRIITSGGEEKMIFCQDRVLTDKDGKVTAILCSAREIEADGAIEQKNALEMLRKQKEELSDFAHSMSHDLKNIFHNMHGFIDLAEEEQNFAHVSRLRSLLNETVEMIEHSVALADAGLVIKETMNVNLSNLLEEVAKSIIPESVEYSQNELPIVNADRSKVAQIFRNLFDNALQHGQPNKIEVVAVKTHGAYLIRIRNDGIAIPELQHSKIFERGYTTSKSGKGYGLAIVKRLAEAHGWKIRLLKESETTFEIEIPIYGHRE